MKLFHGHSHGLKQLTVSADSGEQICSVCYYEVELSGEAYSCTKRDCDFVLHKSCSEIPEKLQHKCDPEHSFSLISEPPRHSLYYNCNACDGLIHGFGYQCDECDRRMHVCCALLPESVECKAHVHDLDLYYTPSKPSVNGCTFFRCDVCNDAVAEGYWSYYCAECNFGTHLYCAASAEDVVEEEAKEEGGEGEENGGGGGDEEEIPIEVKLERARISMEQHRAINEFQLQMARQNAAFMTSIANSWKNF